MNERHALYYAALDADAAYQAALVAEYGKDAGDKRYLWPWQQPAHIRQLAEAKQAADKAWLEAMPIV